MKTYTTNSDVHFILKGKGKGRRRKINFPSFFFLFLPFSSSDLQRPQVEKNEKKTLGILL